MPAPDPGKAFHLTTLRTPGPARVLALHGEMDFDHHLHLRHALEAEIEARPPVLVIDLSDLTFCDSAGLNELLRARRNPYGVPLALTAPGPHLLRLFEITGADRVFVVTDSIEAALQYHGAHEPG